MKMRRALQGDDLSRRVLSAETRRSPDNMGIALIAARRVVGCDIVCGVDGHWSEDDSRMNSI